MGLESGAVPQRRRFSSKPHLKQALALAGVLVGLLYGLALGMGPVSAQPVPPLPPLPSATSVSNSAAVTKPASPSLSPASAQPKLEAPSSVVARWQTLLELDLSKLLVLPARSAPPPYRLERLQNPDRLQLVFPNYRLRPEVTEAVVPLNHRGIRQLAARQTAAGAQLTVWLDAPLTPQALKVSPQGATTLLLQTLLKLPSASEVTASLPPAAGALWAALKGAVEATVSPPLPVKQAKGLVLENTRLTGNTLNLEFKGNVAVKLKSQMILRNPDRLVLDLENTTLLGPAQTLTGGTNQLEQIRIAQFEPTTVRLVLQTPLPDQFHLVYPSPQTVDLASGGQNLLIQETSSMSLASPNGRSLPWSGLKSLTLSGTLARYRLHLEGTGPLDVRVHHAGNGLFLDWFNGTPPSGAVSTAGVGFVQQANWVLNPAGGRTLVMALNGLPRQLTQTLSADKTTLDVEFTLLSLPAAESASATSSAASSGSAPVPGVITNQTLGLPPWGATSGSASTPDKPVPTLPKGRYKVVVDAGHGGKDQGASRQGILEKDLNLAVALYLRQALQAKGFEVAMTRTGDSFVPLKEISGFSNAQAPDVFVSIHHNSSTSSNINGLEVYYYQPQSRTLAYKVHARLAASLPVADRGVRTAMFYVINHTKAPSILCELGYVSNPAELRALNTAQRQRQAAEAIAQGVADYLAGR